MARINTKAKDTRFTEERLAGGFGQLAARQEPLALLRRSVLAHLLWENSFYEDGKDITKNIAALVKQVAPADVAALAIEARTRQKLRHVPLFLARELARREDGRKYLGSLLPKIILRPDELTEFLALYWKDGKQPLAKQVKVGLGTAFENFDAYQFAKYNRPTQIKLRDVMFLVHPHPAQGKEQLYKQIAEDTLPTPDTWEVALSTGSNKKDTWTRLIQENKLGALAFLRNLRNMEQAGIGKDVIKNGFTQLNPRWLLPLNYLAAAKVAPYWEQDLEALMLRGLAMQEKLPGKTVLIVDVSGSMRGSISGGSDFSRLDVAGIMAMLALEMCESVSIYVTAGSDSQYKHKTELIKPRHGFATVQAIQGACNKMGGGGIFTRQALEYIKGLEGLADRIMVFSDSQDCDHANKRTPAPFGKTNYIIDVSSHQRGINYKGVWTAEISGWSEHFLTYIAGLEGLTLAEQE